MNWLPPVFLPIILTFAPLFSKQVWPSALVLLSGAILAPGKRTVSAVLRVMGLHDEPHFQNYHRVLNRACWSSLKASHCLLSQLIQTFVPNAELVMVLDDTIERRWGKRISARGIYRDPVRSSDSHFVKTSGLRWLSLMLLTEIPWAKRVWALPFLTALAPSEKYHQSRGGRHKTLTLWAKQMLKQVRRWYPHRTIILTADSSFAALEFLDALRQLSSPIHVVTRLRLDAALYESAPQRTPGQMGRPRKVGQRLPVISSYLMDKAASWSELTIEGWYGGQSRPLLVLSETAVWYHTGKPPVPIRWVLVKDPMNTFKPQAFLCTDVTQAPAQILLWFRLRWQVEVTFEEVRTHLGFETQRQWSDLAILRTTPALLGIFSIVVILAHQLLASQSYSLAQCAWYQKSLPTFSDALAWVRRQFWEWRLFPTSGENGDVIKVSTTLLQSYLNLLCYAA